jgi:putative lipoprotein
VILQLAVAVSLSQPVEHAADKWFGPDKLKHFFVSAFTQSVAFSVLQAAKVDRKGALAAASAVTAAVSVGKEIHDQRSYGLFSFRDLAWDAAGAGAATLIILHAVRSDDRQSTDAAAISSFQTPDVSLLSGVRPGSILSLRAPQTSASRQ